MEIEEMLKLETPLEVEDKPKIGQGLESEASIEGKPKIEKPKITATVTSRPKPGDYRPGPDSSFSY